MMVIVAFKLFFLIGLYIILLMKACKLLRACNEML